ncbi:MAG: hypothetical protein A3J40_03795 [Erythrobacter sp. RIFCSPHIGHO2_12_FULL_63_10]|nr:MAG: hypothetical protein A3J40_03795 [Erythrobacter sp. RIFCSPHIGHO2_12_FULL_63_10]
MATNATSKIDAAAEKAYAEASAKDGVIAKSAVAPAKPEAKPAQVATPKVAAPKAAIKVAPKKAAPKKAAPKKAVKKIAASKPAAKKAPAAKPAPKTVKTPAKTTSNPLLKFKDTIMAKANETDFAKTAKEMAADVQTRVKTAYAKTGELTSEVTEFSKGNVEALVESGKILFTGIQALGREEIASTKSVVETVTEDMKKIAAVQSPTEFMQLQGELARRNFDAAVSFGSKRTEALVKLYNEAFAPISNRVSLAAERIKKAA